MICDAKLSFLALASVWASIGSTSTRKHCGNLKAPWWLHIAWALNLRQAPPKAQQPAQLRIGNAFVRGRHDALTASKRHLHSSAALSRALTLMINVLESACRMFDTTAKSITCSTTGFWLLGRMPPPLLHRQSSNKSCLWITDRSEITSLPMLYGERLWMDWTKTVLNWVFPEGVWKLRGVKSVDLCDGVSTSRLKCFCEFW